MKPRPLKIGIISYGGAGQAQLSHFTGMGACRVNAVFDPEPAARQRALSRLPGLFVTDRIDEFLASDIAAVAVCSPDSTHAEYMERCLFAGKHVVCEKPLTDSVAGYERILRAQQHNPAVVCAVQHQMRFVPVHLRMKELVRSNQLGQVSYVEGYYVHNLKDRAFVNHTWRLTDNATPLVYSGCHFVDFFRWLLDDEVEEVSAMANHLAFPEYPESDLNVALFRFKSGVIAKLVVAFGAARPQDHTVRVYGEQASIENNLLFSPAGDFKVFCRPRLGTFRGYTRFPPRKLISFCKDLKAVSLGAAMELLMKLQGNSHPFYGVSTYPLRLYEHSIAVSNSLHNFVQSAQTGTQPLCGLRDAARTVATCLAAVEAYRTGRTVKVAEFWSPILE